MMFFWMLLNALQKNVRNIAAVRDVSPKKSWLFMTEKTRFLACIAMPLIVNVYEVLCEEPRGADRQNGEAVSLFPRYSFKWERVIFKCEPFLSLPSSVSLKASQRAQPVREGFHSEKYRVMSYSECAFGLWQHSSLHKLCPENTVCAVSNNSPHHPLFNFTLNINNTYKINACPEGKKTKNNPAQWDSAACLRP